MNLNINCTVQGFPVASTVWEFKSCVNGPSCSDFDNLGGDVSLQHPAPGNTVVSMKSLKVTSSGWLRCVANNSLGRKEGTVAVSISGRLLLLFWLLLWLLLLWLLLWLLLLLLLLLLFWLLLLWLLLWLLWLWLLLLLLLLLLFWLLWLLLLWLLLWLLLLWLLLLLLLLLL
ncbi:hypothetical protein GWK47_052542 [Chionoecetes opilio]|uniref:Ig-like domain-containing protein n=1 Tax=Chionoecetes opilio TaxID=41210 RepID=A0A8J5CRQ2_CHIOP|nr:hypothetical protein GWK47_052542 [Chionoecetes opilio]